MKNIIITLIFTATLTAGVYAMNPSASYLPLMNEAYVNDIPFNTSLIAAFSIPESSLNSVLQVSTEPYTDDIPFDTRAIAEKEKRQLSIIPLLTPDEEPYTDDIPFNTQAIASLTR